MDSKKKKDMFNRLAEFIDYVKVQQKVESANSTGKGKLLYFNRKEIKNV